jgi:opacity protein-like surface antigen
MKTNHSTAASSAIALVLALTAGPALAADPIVRKGPLEPPPAPYSWTGFYIGVNGGYGGGVVSGHTEEYSAQANQLSDTNSLLQGGGFLFGGQLGYNHQLSNNWVIGVETDFQWSGVKAWTGGTNLFNGSGFGFPAADLQAANGVYALDWFGTTRARVGYAFGRFFPYLTAGLAYGQTSATASEGQTTLMPIFLPAPVQLVTARGGQNTTSATSLGWTVGAGLEYALTPNLSLKTEYLYMQLGGFGAPLVIVSNQLPPLFNPHLVAGSLWTDRNEAHVVRAGLNYKFAGFDPSQPLGWGLPAPATGFAAGGKAFNWTGFYLGFNGGFGGGVVNAFSQSLDFNPGNTGAYTDTPGSRTGGFLVGGQIGYNYQFANAVVLGLESDMQWNDVRQSLNEASVFVQPGFADLYNPNNGTSGRALWTGTTRLRLGYAMDRFMPYLSAGVAYGELVASNVMGELNSSGYYDFLSATGSTTSAGWTVGAGVEYAITDQLSAKVEYGFVSLGGVSGPSRELYQGAFGQPNPVLGSFSTGAIQNHIVRAGLNWHVNLWSAPPAIIAKY